MLLPTAFADSVEATPFLVFIGSRCKTATVIVGVPETVRVWTTCQIAQGLARDRRTIEPVAEMSRRDAL